MFSHHKKKLNKVQMYRIGHICIHSKKQSHEEMFLVFIQKTQRHKQMYLVFIEQIRIHKEMYLLFI